ncbi:ABC transporter ATP-binding protein [Lysinibacillus capsici]|uniref:ABC transporter ATP-binding protein n=1 Tax=Lysinibacillus capsici TaxID=2115968 RepID=UPI002731918D|nr:ABC transporter ATP-binding protein [Lysinibacillus capsici]MDP1391782.1 ABC transporter ATP-binding protein [Lysinibacillus capsici]MDP1412260.1 ABC transporter ATP-binding protein [Lysinibacillus capsici]MDP1429110.1 ABC transporter ATP-binding protein [Lysinibacillus capsici]
MTERLLDVENLTVEFKSGGSTMKAVNGVNLQLNKKETLGIVGESGSGKSVTATALMRLIPSPPGKITNGKILFNGRDLIEISEKEMRNVRGNDISMIFQDPITSLNPVLTVGNQIIEVIQAHETISKKDAAIKAVDMLKMVGIPEPEKRLKMYPHEFSGGMRQRVMIAIALACNPKLLIADEPTTALDVTVQAQILDLMKKLQQEHDTAIIMITHDLGVVWELCDKVNVMYAGRTVESTTTRQLYEKPLHPYTWGLLESQITMGTQEQQRLPAIPGSPPDLTMPHSGCHFSARCPLAIDICRSTVPDLVEVQDNHFVACHLQAKDQIVPRKEGIFNATVQ